MFKHELKQHQQPIPAPQNQSVHRQKTKLNIQYKKEGNTN